MWRSALRLAKEILFPVFCVSCKKEGESLCLSCRPEPSQIKINPPEESALQSVTALFDYKKEPKIAELIKTFKYHGEKDVQELWRDLLAPIKFDFPRGAVVIPVPLHSRRLRERGFNQAELVANAVSETAGLMLNCLLLERARATKQQATLGKDERARNVQGAFRARETAPETVVLIDDVYTTGATLNECAKALQKAGAKTIYGFVLAKD